MKLNWKIRLKSWRTWLLAIIPVITIIWSAGGFQVSDLDSWTQLGLSFMTFLKSPAAIIAVVSALIATYVDPTTKGLEDSDLVMNKKSLKGDDK
ncbi:phage holin [Listeria aquatica]|uniref:phage holin n=1 Tax=Listeria aquatica TaxID=1494960 RepID=UPI003F70CDE5